MLGAEIGRGGMGSVVAAEQSSLQRTVALKYPLGKKLTSRFIEEAYVSAYLNHPSIIQIHDLVIGPNGVQGLVMPLIEAAKLAQQSDG